MVDVVIRGIVAADVLERIPWKIISTMVIDSLRRTEREEAHALAGSHAGGFVGNRGSQSIEKEPFKRMIIKGAICIGYI